MKYYSKLLIAALMALCALPALAQLNGSGYYRIRNAEHTENYISMANDLFNYHIIASNAGGGLRKLITDAGKARALECAGQYLATDIHMVHDADCIDPGSVIYAKKDVQNNYNLIGQGTSLLTLTTGTYAGSIEISFHDLYITIEKNGGSGANTLYTAKIELKGDPEQYLIWSTNLGYRYLIDNGGKLAINSSNSANNAKWYIEPVTHFNVLPEVELNGKWYTTVKVPFTFTLSGSVERAYAITDNSLNSSVVAEAGGTVPAGTPVILQCSSPNAADCQLIPTGIPVFTAPDVSVTSNGAPAATDVIAPTADNLLVGTYYCNTDGNMTYTTESGTSYFNANHRQEASGKYVIGKDANGKLGFITATGNVEGNVMPANKAWLTSGGLFPSVDPPTFSLEAGTYTGTQNVTITAEDGATIYYSTDGTTWNEYSDAIPVDETMTISAKAIKPGLFNDSEIATSIITIAQPELTVNPTKLTISDAAAGAFTVTGSNLGTDDVGVTSSVFSMTTTDQYWGFVNNNGSVSGTVNVTYEGRELAATGTVNVANNLISTTVDVTYVPDIYIVTDGGVTGNWNFSNGNQMTNEDGIYTGTFNATVPNTFILFARKLGDGVDWNTRYVFGPDSDGDWVMPADKATEYGNIDVNDDDPIKLPYAGEYTITINANEKTFSITRTIETLDKPTFSPEGGTYTEPTTVTITATNGATIHYTTDGNNPTTDSPIYSNPIIVNEGTTAIKAIAVLDGWNPSDVASATYVVEIPVTVLLGDVDENGLIEIKDVTDLIDYLLGNEVNPFNFTNADVSQDNEISIKDVTDLIDILLSM